MRGPLSLASPSPGCIPPLHLATEIDSRPRRPRTSSLQRAHSRIVTARDLRACEAVKHPARNFLALELIGHLANARPCT